jgi:class 3 adenylate cyclase/YHS domain-containing protein
MSDEKEIQRVFLIGDLSGYTALTEAHGSMSAAQIVKRYNQIVQECLYKDAKIVETVGDEVLIVGNDGARIIQTALELRRKVEKEPDFPSVHVGIHAGSVLQQEGQYFGSAINIASRVAAHARADQILCTDSVIEVLRKMATVKYRALGKVFFKNVIDPIALFEITNDRHDNLFEITNDRHDNATVTDLVCRMHVKPDTAPARIPHNGQTYFFCSFECAKAFVSRPDRYVKR